MTTFIFDITLISLEIRATEKTISENDFSVLMLLEDNVPCNNFNGANPTSSLSNIETWSNHNQENYICIFLDHNNEALSNIIQDFLFWPFYLPGIPLHRPICEPGACQYEKWNRAGRLSTTTNLHFIWKVRTWFAITENKYRD